MARRKAFGDVVASVWLQRALADLRDEHGVVAAAKMVGVSRESFVRLAGGSLVKRGTAALAEYQLRDLTKVAAE